MAKARAKQAERVRRVMAIATGALVKLHAPSAQTPSTSAKVVAPPRAHATTTEVAQQWQAALARHVHPIAARAWVLYAQSAQTPPTSATVDARAGAPTGFIVRVLQFARHASLTVVHAPAQLHARSA